MVTGWLTSLITKSASEIEGKNKAIYRFGQKMAESVDDRPIQEWEADCWVRGINRRLIRMEGHFFRVGTGKSGCLSFFIRNDAGLYVGLRREAITQAATFVRLITEYGYDRSSTRFETGWMDVAVFDKSDHAILYAENKARAKTLEKLCDRLVSGFRDTIPFMAESDKVVDDPLMKACHLWRHRPRYFWAVSPTLRRPYEVEYTTRGFVMNPIADVPTAHGGAY